MNKPFLILLLLTLFCKYSFTQNLVPNGNFEDTVQCPSGGGQIEFATGWINPNGYSPDYFNSCDACCNSWGVPYNFYGFQNPLSGIAYAGIYIPVNANNDLREYIQIQLTEVLIHGLEYVVRFNVSLADSSIFSVNSLGAYLSDNQINSSTLKVFDVNPQVVNNPIINPLTDKNIWYEISDTIIALGGEKYITIGNFQFDSLVDTTTVVGGGLNTSFAAYYYVDDVSITKIEKLYPNVFTPNNDNINDFWMPTLIGENDIITIYNRWGQKITTLNYINNKWDGKTQKDKECPSGVYYFTTNTNEKGFIQLIR